MIKNIFRKLVNSNSPTCKVITLSFVLKTANNNKGQFKIANISDDVMELFKLLQLHNVFEIYNTVDDAVKSFE